MQAGELGDLDLEKGGRERAVAHGGVPQRGGVSRNGADRVMEPPHLVVGRGQAIWRPVGQAIVVVVNAGERRVDRTKPVVALEEAFERRHRANGSETQRRSWNECSTALMTSWIHAPSPKSPSFDGSSLRISVMKLLTRLA